jgi:hypothetical protein
MNNKFLKYFFFSISLVLLNSCDLFENDNLIIKMDKKTFENERLLWNSQNIENYQFTYTFFNDAGPVGPIKITIRKNETQNIENSNQYDDYITIAENIMEIYDYINETFDFIETVKNGTYDGHEIRTLTLNITYDTQYHYPKKVDFSAGYVEMIDGGAYYTLRIIEFEPL